ncbi:MAG: hypothetical protein K9N55_16195, partial [Phycisphaerae bacterium]|nr:hypothetical protein [Phycisphaerae bacterium]
MTLIDYPGHLWTSLIVLLTVGWMLWAFGANALMRLGHRRWGLAVLACLPVLLSLWFLANPGRLAPKTKTRPCTVLALFDTSESMSVTQDETTRLDLAIDQFQRTFKPDSPSSPAFQYYGFDRRCVSAASLKQLNRWGKRSNLMEAWSLMSPWLVPPTQKGPGDISGIVIFTDGQVDQPEVAVYARQENPDIPVVLVGVGSEQVGPDVAITRLQAPAQVGLHQAYPVTVTLETMALDEQSVYVDLYLNDHLIETYSVIPRADSRTTTVECTLNGTALGTDMVRAHARMADPEANLRNNDRYHIVQIVANDKLKVLLYSEVA